MTNGKKFVKEAMPGDRLLIFGEMGVGLAHEVNNQLHVILANIEAVEGIVDPRAAAERIGMVKDTVLQTKAMMQEMLMFARRQKLRSEPLDVNGLIKKSADLFRYRLEEAKIDLVLELCQSPFDAWCNKNLFPQVMLNLLKNARESMVTAKKGSRIIIRSFVSEDGKAIIEVSDDGPGVDSENIGDIFTPFFTTRAEGGGTGLGLSISRIIVEAIGGSIDVLAPQGGGAAFRITLRAGRDAGGTVRRA